MADNGQNGGANTRQIMSRRTMQRRVKSAFEQLRHEINAYHRLTEAEKRAFRRVALCDVVAETALKRAAMGLCPVDHATRAQSTALRARQHLKQILATDETTHAA